MYSLARPFLFSLDAERAHGLGLSALDLAYRTGTTPLLAARIAPMPSTVFGLTFPNPAARPTGEHIDALFALGFGFVEIGTITPRPQAGNPQPRLFRLPEHNAIINRMGFNNAGVDALVRNVERARNRRGLLGINIGKNKDTPNEQAVDDYIACLDKVYALADYITVNISSPNTAGLRELQEETALRQLVSQLRDRQEELAARHGRRVPMLVKVAPDLSERDIDAAARVLGELQVDGVIATNTTIDHSKVAGDPLANEAGGLSGAPVLEQSTLVLRRLRSRLPESVPLVGVGGILSGADAVAKMAAGAALVQCYSGLIFRGPALVSECVEAIRRRREAPSRGAVAPL